MLCKFVRRRFWATATEFCRNRPKRVEQNIQTMRVKGSDPEKKNVHIVPTEEPLKVNFSWRTSQRDLPLRHSFCFPNTLHIEWAPKMAHRSCLLNHRMVPLTFLHQKGQTCGPRIGLKAEKPCLASHKAWFLAEFSSQAPCENVLTSHKSCTPPPFPPQEYSKFCSPTKLLKVCV